VKTTQSQSSLNTTVGSEQHVAYRNIYVIVVAGFKIDKSSDNLIIADNKLIQKCVGWS
jgi:hypothetical protein